MMFNKIKFSFILDAEVLSVLLSGRPVRVLKIAR